MSRQKNLVIHTDKKKKLFRRGVHAAQSALIFHTEPSQCKSCLDLAGTIRFNVKPLFVLPVSTGSVLRWMEPELAANGRSTTRLSLGWEKNAISIMNLILISNTMLPVIAWRHKDVACHYSVILALKLAQEDYPLMVFHFHYYF